MKEYTLKRKVSSAKTFFIFWPPALKRKSEPLQPVRGGFQTVDGLNFPYDDLDLSDARLGRITLNRDVAREIIDILPPNDKWS